MRFNIVSIRKTLVTTCCLLLIGILAGSIIAFGQNESTPNSTETAAVVTTSVNATATLQPTLDISANQTVTVGNWTFVEFQVTSNGSPVSGVTVTLSGGNANGTGTSNSVGSAVIYMNANTPGTITATASKNGFTNGTTTIAAVVAETNALAPWFKLIIEGLVFLMVILLLRYAIAYFMTNSNMCKLKVQSEIQILISFLILVISFGIWIYQVLLQKIDILGVLGAGVFGGIILDISVNKGEIIVPRQDEDGISLGVIYGAVMGFIIAISVFSNSAIHYAGNINLYDTLTVFLAAATVKGASEYVSTDTLTKKKKKASISFNLKDEKEKLIEEGSTYPSPDALKFKVDGEILISEVINERQVVHLNFKKEGNVLIVKDTPTNDKNPTKFEDIDISGVKLEVGKWEAWVSWDGDNAYDKAESTPHKNFEIK
jgi:hypothetical protein